MTIQLGGVKQKIDVFISAYHTFKNSWELEDYIGSVDALYHQVAVGREQQYGETDRGLHYKHACNKPLEDSDDEEYQDLMDSQKVLEGSSVFQVYKKNLYELRGYIRDHNGFENSICSLMQGKSNPIITLIKGICRDVRAGNKLK
jgi:hypothetical protein